MHVSCPLIFKSRYLIRKVLYIIYNKKIVIKDVPNQIVSSSTRVARSSIHALANFYVYLLLMSCIILSPRARLICLSTCKYNVPFKDLFAFNNLSSISFQWTGDK